MNEPLRQARLFLGLTQQQLADMIGASAFSVCRWERGQLPNAVLRQRLCHFFRRSEAELGFLVQNDRQNEAQSGRPAWIDPAIPPSVSPLIGRTELSAQLKQYVIHARGMVRLAGLPGIGKMALAPWLATDPEVQAAFPDGILWMSLGTEGQLSQQFARWTLSPDIQMA